jgi:surface polysaccharide O-acyltransferase-like enzyme
VAFASGLVRLWSPIDRWLNLFGFFRVAFADVPRDLTFFVLGALAYRRGWFERWPVRSGCAWLAVGVVAGAARYAYSLALWQRFPGIAPIVDASYPVWESLLCFGMCIGLLVLFREAVTAHGGLARFLADNQYSAYFWHPLLIVPMQMVLLGVVLAPLAKFAIVSAAGVVVVFLWSALVRTVPAVRSIL